ncbi:methyltransferase domain-containing protein [Dellaglioa algida]|uniref:23S rRNA m(1)G 745 methyltransferase n=1 Tax=Dellaglioa algida DSM 15638 TaxID=1423719 RepID=A0A0R1HQ34_9LACO|nr:methyltransferase domain-containing protein [Dellaglioa algida]KRK45378.1 23S rRNA m(1)G 745 methyltransferase [Dellaglioa algida DSM 15638]MDK1728724.1 methyltransferase domain-containing protein [Dellaglioa algida]MDK1733281.1 methyltransferase domain-containing protein [Dellaglioa algida]MDK1734802.1 methyltransferase domain-containing protein [Dellaglioa algida]MDK1736283.1 methyltransferase domain-containing protein [Dellaglioa algida]
MKKIEKSAIFLKNKIDLFRCPVCLQPYSEVRGQTMICPDDHQVDLSKKGTLYFLNHGVKSDYELDMWLARRQLLQAGLFKPITDKILEQLSDESETIMDVGCGEGTPLHNIEVARQNSQDTYVGFDISKDAINYATQQETDAFYCIADLAKLPFNNQSFSTIIDIFSPSAYAEFDRVLEENGQLLKIIPNSNYLVELRELLYNEESHNRSYSNEKVLNLFKEKYPDSEQIVISYQFDIPEGLFPALLEMTPLHWGATSDNQTRAKAHPLKQITVDVTLLKHRKNKSESVL